MGQLAAFRLGADGTPEVLMAALPGASFYAKRVVMAPSGDHLFVVDANTPENGGGIYRVDIGCDGSLTDRGLVAAARTPGGLVVREDGKAVVSANSVLGTPAGDTVHLLDLAASPVSVVDGVNAFTRPDLFVGGFAASYTGGLYMVGDVNAFDGQPNGVAVVRVTDQSLTTLNVVTGIEDPQGIAFAPAGGLALVTSALEDDAIFLVDDNGPSNAWRVRGEVSYTGGNPQLPGDLTSIQRGSLDGHVFVSEVTGIRHLRFDGDTVVDLGVSDFGGESLGAIGIQP
jgi:DNA-binding beta-propeller fold protein YncE